ncbi:hypothetical protein L218DRAFT_1071922 [Marasmius fiardii PR-910]|nr:hypothetical protein L218DRAFT_1071922 [Marasmius fiardii PR-910]
MAITFTPSLGESVSIPVSTWDIHTGGFVQVKFRATLSVEEFQRLGLGSAGGSQVQVWSDFPSPSQDREGEWGEMGFEVDSDSQGENESQYRESVTLSCVFSVPFHPLARSREFSFTYRILHCDSEASWVEWLGSFEQNGVLNIHFESRSPESSGYPLVLGEGWIPTMSSGPGSSHLTFSHTLNCTSGTSRHALTVKDKERWGLVSAVGRDGYSVPPSTHNQQGQEASMLFLVPKRTQRDPALSCLVRPELQMFVIAASPESMLFFSLESGEIEIMLSNGGSSVVLQAFTSDSSEDVDSLWNSTVHYSFNSNQNGLRLVSLGDEKRTVVLASSPKTFPAELTLIPLTRWRSEDELGVELSSLSKEPGIPSLIGASGAQMMTLATFSESELTQNIRITTLNDSSDSSLEHPTPIPTLNPVKLSPFTPLSTSDKVSICILTPHQNVNLDMPPTPVYTTAGSGNGSGSKAGNGNGNGPSAGDEEALPTPPPSPLLRPIAHLKGHKGNDSMASISDIGIPSRVHTPEVTVGSQLRSSSSQTLRVVSSRLNIARQISMSPSPSSSSSPPASRGSGEVLKRPAGLVACLRQFFFATGFFVIFMLRRLLCGIGSRALRRLGFGSGTARYHSPSGSGYVTPNGENEREGRHSEESRDRREEEEMRSPADERTPLLSQSQTMVASIPTLAVNVDGNEAVVPSSSSSASSSPSSERRAETKPASTPVFSNVLSFTRTFELLDTTANHVLVLRGVVDFKLNDKVKFDVDDQPVVIRDFKNVEGEPDAWIVELGWRKSGRLTVTYSA